MAPDFRLRPSLFFIQDGITPNFVSMQFTKIAYSFHYKVVMLDAYATLFIGHTIPALSVEDAARILGTIAPGLDEAHSKGIVHRDIKPSNILFDRHGNPYISDFGIAKLSQAQAGNVTGSAIIGTPAYMAPDQAARWLLPEPERSAAASPATGAIIKILEHYCSRISLTRLGPR